MCTPLAGMMALGIATSAFQAVGQYQTASTQADIAESQWEADNRARQLDYLNQLNMIQNQQQEVNEAAAEDKSERALAAMKERARLRVASGEAGIGGITPVRLESVAALKESKDVSSIESKRSRRISQLQESKRIARARAQGSQLFINRPSAGMTALQAGLGIGSQVALYGARKQYYKDQ